MKKKFHFTLFLISIAIICLFTSCVPKTSSKYLDGEINTAFVETYGECKMTEFTIKYHLNFISEKPSGYIDIKWKREDEISTDCFRKDNFEIFINIVDQNNEYWIPAQNFLVPIPKGNNTWSKDARDQTINWDRLLLKEEPLYAFEESKKLFLPANIAQSIWKSGYLKIKSIKLIEKNGDGHSYDTYLQK